MTGERKVPLKACRALTTWVKARKFREDYALKCEKGFTEPSKVIEDVCLAMRRVVTPEVTMSYYPGKSVVIGAGQVGAPLGQDCPALYYFTYVRSRGSLEVVARELSVLGYAPTVSEVDLDGTKALLIAWHCRKTNGTFKVWLSPSEGYWVRKVQGINGEGKVLEERIVVVRRYAPEIFWIERGEESFWFDNGDLLRRYCVTVKELALNVPVDDKLFTLEGLGVPPGTEVHDVTLGVTHNYGEPFELPPDFIQSVLGKGGAAKVGALAVPSKPAPSAVNAQPPTAEPPLNAEQPGPTPAPRRRWGLWLGLVGITLVCGALIVAIVRRRVRTRSRNTP
jgi:hypothetical protein